MTRRRACMAAAWLAGLVATSGGACSPAPSGRPVTVFAAASLGPAFSALAADSAAADGLAITFNFAGSQVLAAQIAQGSPADVFAAADETTSHKVADAGLAVDPAVVFATNRLAIAVAPGNPRGIHTLADLARPGLSVVLAAPEVPAGRYAAAALSRAGVVLQPRSLEVDVTTVALRVSTGDADAGIVYTTDIASAGNRLSGIDIPDQQNVIARYPALVLRGPHPAAARDFIAALLGTRGQAILRRQGFGPPPK